MNRRIVPARDLADEDVGERGAVHVQQVLHAGQVVHHRRRCKRPWDLDAALAGGELVRRERRVARAEVDRSAGDRVDSAARADRAVLELVAELRADRRDPRRDERADERAARTDERGAAVLRRGGAGAACRDARESRCKRDGDDGANRVADLRHRYLSSFGVLRPRYGGPRGGWDTGLWRAGYEVVTFSPTQSWSGCTVSRWRSTRASTGSRPSSRRRASGSFPPSGGPSGPWARAIASWRRR